VAALTARPSRATGRAGKPVRRGALLGLTGFGAVRAALLAGAAMLATRLLGPHDRGLMVLGASFAAVAALLAGMGTGSALRSLLPGADGPERRLLTASFAWWMLLSAGASGILAALLSVLSAGAIDGGLGRPSFVGAVLGNAAALVALTQLPDLWYASGRFRSGSAWATGVAAANVLGLLVAATHSDSAAALLTGQAAGPAVAWRRCSTPR
jgi:O-antigen/teichoic acid export membrane protein